MQISVLYFIMKGYFKVLLGIAVLSIASIGIVNAAPMTGGKHDLKSNAEDKSDDLIDENSAEISDENYEDPESDITPESETEEKDDKNNIREEV